MVIGSDLLLVTLKTERSNNGRSLTTGYLEPTMCSREKPQLFQRFVPLLLRKCCLAFRKQQLPVTGMSRVTRSEKSCCTSHWDYRHVSFCFYSFFPQQLYNWYDFIILIWLAEEIWPKRQLKGSQWVGRFHTRLERWNVPATKLTSFTRHQNPSGSGSTWSDAVWTIGQLTHQ